MSDVVQALKDQISAGKIKFDAGSEARLRSELLGENAGTKVTAKLQGLMLELSKLVATHLRVSSLIRQSGHHSAGRAFDIGNEEIVNGLLPQVATNSQVAALNIDELIFDAAVAGHSDRNKWNYDRGQKHDYNSATLDQHRNHIHFAVTL